MGDRKKPIQIKKKRQNKRKKNKRKNKNKKNSRIDLTSLGWNLRLEMNFPSDSFLFAILLVFAMAIAGSSGTATANWPGFSALGQPGGAPKQGVPAPAPRSLSPIVGGTCKIVCDGVYQKFQMDTMKVILPCDSACKVVDLLAEGMTEAFVIAISGPENPAKPTRR